MSGDDVRDDRTLLAAHVNGDRDAFGVLFRRHRDRLWSVALRTTGDPEEAADALQEAMISAFRKAGSFRGDAAVTTWLHRVVVNACLDRHRRRAVRAAEPLPDDLEERAGRGALVTSTATGPDRADPADVVLDDEQRSAVLAALARLAPDQRAALVLVDLEGYSVEEAAAVLGCPTGTVKSRCARGRARLAPLLAPLLGSPDASPAVRHPGRPVQPGHPPAQPTPATAPSTAGRGEPPDAGARPSTATGGGEIT